MKQQMLEQEVKELKTQLALMGQLVDISTVAIEAAGQTIKRLREENAAMKRVLEEQRPTVGLGPSGASLDRELVNGRPNGFVAPKRYEVRVNEDEEPPMILPFPHRHMN